MTAAIKIFTFFIVLAWYKSYKVDLVFKKYFLIFPNNTQFSFFPMWQKCWGLGG
jgi:hypothetical protein